MVFNQLTMRCSIHALLMSKLAFALLSHFLHVGVQDQGLDQLDKLILEPRCVFQFPTVDSYKGTNPG